MQPRNDRLKFLALRLGKKKKCISPHNHIDHAQYLPNKQTNEKNQAHKLHPQIRTHVINSLEPREQQSASSVARRPRVLPPSGENAASGGSGVSGFRTCWSRDSNFKGAEARAPPPPARRRAGPWEALRPVPGGCGGRRHRSRGRVLCGAPWAPRCAPDSWWPRAPRAGRTPR